MNDFTNCPYWGIGGRYVFDPVTGNRTPVPANDTPAPLPAADVVADTQTATPEGEHECQT